LGDLRGKIFSQVIDDSLNRVRTEMSEKYKPKKENRFFTNGITYEIGYSKLSENGLQYEISSKIPPEYIPMKGLNLRYFNEVKGLMNKGFKKPLDTRMENIIRSTDVNEIKERDYVQCVFFYKNEELYSEDEVGKMLKSAAAGKMTIPEVGGVSTMAGRAVITIISGHVYNIAKNNITDLVKANEVVMKKLAPLAKKVALIVQKAGNQTPKAKKISSAKVKKKAKATDNKGKAKSKK
jgi:hypothetical protein